VLESTYFSLQRFDEAREGREDACQKRYGKTNPQNRKIIYVIVPDLLEIYLRLF
jgi:hypothetical protein